MRRRHLHAWAPTFAYLENTAVTAMRDGCRTNPSRNGDVATANNRSTHHAVYENATLHGTIQCNKYGIEARRVVVDKNTQV